jgi:hypothetical protein
VATWNEFPPGADHRLTIVCNGGPLDFEAASIFIGLKPKFFPRKNDAGRDLSGYQNAVQGPARNAQAVLCLGESVYFHRAGWLRRLADAWDRLGPGFYGPFSSNSVRAHLNTTAFLCSPQLLAGYPPVIRWDQRYEFEHGKNALWRVAHSKGLPVRLVTWDDEWEPHRWRIPANILWKGTQENCLMWANHSDRYFAAPPQTRWGWEQATNQPFQ